MYAPDDNITPIRLRADADEPLPAVYGWDD